MLPNPMKPCVAATSGGGCPDWDGDRSWKQEREVRHQVEAASGQVEGFREEQVGDVLDPKTQFLDLAR
jgi:hypothetical protein